MEFVIGAAGAVFALLLVAGGFFAGWKAQKAISGVQDSTPEIRVQSSKNEQKRMEEELNAFQTLMGYNMDLAYGNQKGVGLTNEGGDEP